VDVFGWSLGTVAIITGIDMAMTIVTDMTTTDITTTDIITSPTEANGIMNYDDQLLSPL
jgi:hypothetical protein